MSPKAISIKARAVSVTRAQVLIEGKWVEISAEKLFYSPLTFSELEALHYAGGLEMTVHSPYDPLRPDIPKADRPKPQAPAKEPEACWNCDAPGAEVQVYCNDERTKSLRKEGVKVCSPCAGDLTEGEETNWTTEKP